MRTGITIKVGSSDRLRLEGIAGYREGFPKSLFEAMAVERPAITTDTTVCRDVIEDGVSGILVPLYDATALADALQKLAENVALRRKLGAAARKRTEALFSEKIISEKTMALYEIALDAKSAG